MYLGMVAIVLGAALVAGSTTPWLIVPVFWWVLATRFVAPEEAAMRRQFGEAYARYARRVPRWLGRPPIGGSGRAE
jgi:protein-S-isoprenylcysteine O-methyltransferase Ste14